MSQQNYFEKDQSFADRRFDEFLHVHGKRKIALFDWLESICVQQNENTRKRRLVDRMRLELSRELVVANALKASFPIGRCVHYSRKLETYSRRSVYHPYWLRSKALLNAIDQLAQCGMLELTTGNLKRFDRPARQSTFAPTNDLIRGLAEIGISHEDVFRDDGNAPALILKDAKKQLVDYDPTHDQIQYAINCIRRFNDFIGHQSLEFPIPEGEWEAACGENKRTFPDPKQCSLYRVFNNSDWTQGGRFYGGWWQSIPSQIRHRIKINGEETTELDFSGFLTRAIYNDEQLAFAGDPYDIPAIREASDVQGLDWEIIRPSIKLLLNALINASVDDKLGGISALKFPKGITRKKALALIEQHHCAIAHRFRSGRGLWIMFRESLVCLQVLMDGVAANIPVLPIHDSFLVQKRYGRWLRESMKIAYQTQFLFFNPVIKEKGKDYEGTGTARRGEDNKFSNQPISPSEVLPLKPLIEETVILTDSWPTRFDPHCERCLDTDRRAIASE